MAAVAGELVGDPPSLFSVEAGADAPAAVVSGPTVRMRLVVAYVGTGFRGFAAQPRQRTVAGVLSAALERYLRHTVELTCAGRTDAGVHAWGQVVSFDAREGVDPVGLQRALNRALRPEVVVRSAEVAEPGFDARRWATGRRYRYTVLNAAVADPFAAGTAWHVDRELDLRAMQLACDPLYGEHDFSSFCRRPPGGGSLVRLVREAGWHMMGPAAGSFGEGGGFGGCAAGGGLGGGFGGGFLRFEIEASSFCQQMVRALVGTLVDIGLGKRRAGEMAGILRAEDRGAAGQLAPPHGLCLWEVGYVDRGAIGAVGRHAYRNPSPGRAPEL